MKNRARRIGVALVAAALLATAAQAAWVRTGPTTVLVDGHIEVEVIPMGPHTSPLGRTLDTYQVNLNALNALGPRDVVAAVDVTFRPAAGQQACGLYQMGWWVSPPGILTATPDRNMSQCLVDELSDTHFLLNELFDPLVEDPNDPNCGDWGGGEASAYEDNDRSVGVNAHGESEGLGTYLTVYAFITPHAVRQYLDFAWITVPTGCTAEFAGEVANGWGDVFSFVDPAIPIPEPASAILALTGALAFVRRRGRRK